MKYRLFIFASACATIFLMGCQGSSNNNPATTTTSAACTSNVTYGANGQPIQQGCVSPNAYNGYGYNNGYNGYANAGNGNNPCAVYNQQTGMMWYPGMVNGTMMCVSAQ